MTIPRLLLTVATVAVLATAGGQASFARSGVKIGLLNCNVQGGASFIFGSSRDINCVYTPAGKGRPEHYTGEINRWGIDIGYVSKGKMVWAVFAPTSNVRRGALAGNYGGVTASVAAGYGVGANALIGGSDRSMVLQPLSVQAQEGLNIAAGVSAMELMYVQ